MNIIPIDLLRTNSKIDNDSPLKEVTKRGQRLIVGSRSREIKERQSLRRHVGWWR